MDHKKRGALEEYIRDNNKPSFRPFEIQYEEQKLAREKCKAECLRDQNRHAEDRQRVETKAAAAVQRMKGDLDWMQMEDEMKVIRQAQWQKIQDELDVDFMMVRKKMTPKIQYLVNPRVAIRLERTKGFIESLTQDQKDIEFVWWYDLMRRRDTWDKMENYAWEDVWARLWKKDDMNSSIKAKREAWLAQQAELAKEEAKRQEERRKYLERKAARAAWIARSAEDKAIRKDAATRDAEEFRADNEAAEGGENEAGVVGRWCQLM